MSDWGKEESTSGEIEQTYVGSGAVSPGRSSGPSLINQKHSHQEIPKVKTITFDGAGIPAAVYKEFFSLSKAGIACFEFIDEISTNLAPEKIADQIWLNQSACIEVNNSMALTLGYPDTNSIIKESFATLFPANEKNYAIVREWIQKEFRLSRIETIEKRGETEPHIIQTSLYSNIIGDTIKRLWLLIKDVSDTRIAEMAKVQEEQYYRELMNLPNLILLRRKPSGALLYLSPHVEAIVGYNAKDFKEKPKLIKQLLHCDDYARFNMLTQVRKDRSTEVVETEYRVRHHDGTYHWLRERQVPRISSSGEIEYYDSLIFDIQERKQLEMALGQAQCLETVGTLAEGIAHDFNNYLAAILGQLNLSLKELDPEHPCHRRLASAEQAALRCAEMTRHLLTFGRTTEFKLQLLDTKSLVQETIELLRHLLPATIEIKVQISSDLNSIKGNFTQLQQVLMNLAVNSRDAMVDGGILKIEAKNIELEENFESTMFPQAVHGAYVEISVTDNGKGIPEVCLPHIFDPFFTTKSGDKGSGLGLSMTYSIIKSHDGFIHISSKEDLGTSVVMMLPSADLPSRTIPSSTIVTSPRGNETVLVAEDDELVLSMVESALALHGYTVITASDGQEAIDLFRTHRNIIDIALIDQTMPKLTGMDVIEQIYAISPEMRIILTSGYSEKKLKAGLNEKYSRFISKPFPVPKLLALLRELLDIE